jgi:hypothetical protein
MKTARGTCWDLAACFVWKQVELGFPSLALRLTEARWRVVHVVSSQRLRRVQTEDERVDAMGYIWPCYSYFIVFIVLGHKGSLVFCLVL